MGFRFRSKTEIEIAKELDRAGVLFFPNCGARLNGYSLPNDLENVRRTYEPDFLVCAGGRWGILEVDGEPYHPAERAAYDHERDRLFKNHGIRVVERYDASRCWSNPHEVVREFLKLLDTESGWQP
jgi:very-short-patch-repair endonuclease